MEHQPASMYTQLNSLQNLKGLEKKNPTQALEKVAKEFESLFTHMLLKSMRAANQVFKEGNYFNSNETQFFEEMFDSQLSVELSKGKGIGLADMLIKQMAPQAAVSQPQVAPMPFDQAAKQRQLSYTLSYVQAMKAPPEQEGKLNENQRKDNPTQAKHPPLYNAVMVGEEKLIADSHHQPITTKLTNILSQLTGTGIDPNKFSRPEAFIKHVYPIAKKLTSAFGFNPAVLVAQAALETGWGKHIIQHKDGNSSYNLFGIKADRRWQGDKTHVNTTEYRQGIAIKEKAAFRSYDSIAASINDYMDFLQVNPRYKTALTKRDNPEQFLNALQQAGYATDPNYAKKILKIANGPLFKSAIDKL
ncbi:flagellar assembly peptidoglycan hydrolase FlgJ [Spartinivicinus poritis]|uniref:Peptidoglycan hydrolase FlgJ n=1 Tax=Spartinivicinus poritis TaxID=2994640 RepID=A0ABT5UAV7_9GAMM|nr:flagellar assembly peptidoglycan hydrolase FlgJ [Spartinivicinus sp. A2-2]MDE1463511.1 flagellar assembly peptidoglycan hydrolase FlgJ [Spartinivicinus sp. A2-2]